MQNKNNQTELGAIFYPTKDQAGNPIPFDSLYLPYIWKEIYFDGIFIDVLNQKKDMVIIDIGSQVGLTVFHFQPYAKKLYAIEPSPESFSALEKNIQFNKWTNCQAFNIAFSDRNGEMAFGQSKENRTMNSLMFDKGMPAKYGEPIKVKTQSIDTFFEENGIEHVDFIKADVEGAEDMIFRSEGFKKVASKIDTIMLEFHFPDWMKLVEYMTQFGFKARRYDSSAVIVLFFR